jgi:hypothetical protein
MFERREYLPLVAESSDDEIRVHPALDPLLEFAVSPLGKVDRTHCPAAYLAIQPVVTEVDVGRQTLAL